MKDLEEFLDSFLSTKGVSNLILGVSCFLKFGVLFSPKLNEAFLGGVLSSLGVLKENSDFSGSERFTNLPPGVSSMLGTPFLLSIFVEFPKLKTGVFLESGLGVENFESGVVVGISKVDGFGVEVGLRSGWITVGLFGDFS